MCEFVSVVATTKGPLKFYAAPGLNSHGNARAGWNLTKDCGAEVEWTSESYNYLSVRHEEPLVAKTIKQMIVDKFANRASLLATITETRGPSNDIAFYKNGVRIFTITDGGPNFEEVNELLKKLPKLLWAKPVNDLSEEVLGQLVAEHLFNLGKHNANCNVFDGVTLKVVNTWKECDAARGAARGAARDAAYGAAYDAAYDAACDAARGAAYDAAYGAARDAAYGAAYDAARDAARGAAYDAARGAAYLISGLENNPFSSLIEIYALGCVPVGIVDEEFVVFVPPIV